MRNEPERMLASWQTSADSGYTIIPGKAVIIACHQESRHDDAVRDSGG
jgi:hypothetical protein